MVILQALVLVIILFWNKNCYSNNMYIVLYSFKVKSGEVKNFIESWTELTNLIFKHEGSLGSRLHKRSPLEYVAYAQWPTKDIFESSGGNLPEKANKYRDLMRVSCNDIEVTHKFEVVKDLLVNKIYE